MATILLALLGALIIVSGIWLASAVWELVSKYQ
jgi:hypothetical protein